MRLTSAWRLELTRPCPPVRDEVRAWKGCAVRQRAALRRRFPSQRRNGTARRSHRRRSLGVDDPQLAAGPRAVRRSRYVTLSSTSGHSTRSKKPPRRQHGTARFHQLETIYSMQHATGQKYDPMVGHEQRGVRPCIAVSGCVARDESQWAPRGRDELRGLRHRRPARGGSASSDFAAGRSLERKGRSGRDSGGQRGPRSPIDSGRIPSAQAFAVAVLDEAGVLALLGRTAPADAGSR